MARGSGKLRGITKIDGNYIWNSSGTIEGSVVYLELQIRNWLESFDPKNVQIWQMTKDEEDDDV